MQQIVVMIAASNTGCPLERAADIAGLGLNMPPPFWDRLRGRLQSSAPVPWLENSQILDVGACSLIQREAVDDRPPAGK